MLSQAPVPDRGLSSIIRRPAKTGIRRAADAPANALGLSSELPLEDQWATDDPGAGPAMNSARSTGSSLSPPLPSGKFSSARFILC